MSGIMAIVSLDGRPIPREMPRAQLAAIAHRGERAPRFWEAPGVALGHVNMPRTPEAERELLPGSDRGGRYWLTWDGRLDNRDELALKLGYDAAERAEKTDADYTLDSFVRWGDDCVHHLLGDWAVVVWDNEARRLFCAKDPLGWRQLYYAEHEGLLAVGSEPQQFFAHGWFQKAPNLEHLCAFLADIERSVSTTCYQGIRSLPGGATLTVVGGRLREVPYWTAPEGKPVRRDVNSLVDELSHVLSTAVRSRMRSNSPVGVFLSGGLDSSYVAGLAARHGAKTAISGFAPNTKRFDERHYIRLVQEHCGLPVELVDVSDCWPLSSRWVGDDMLDTEQLPIQAAMYLKLGRASRQAGLGVVLGGEGADEWVDGRPSAIGALLEGRRSLATELFSTMGLKTRRSKAGQLAADSFEEVAPTWIARAAKRLTDRYTYSERDRSHFAIGVSAKPMESPDSIPAWRRKKRAVREWRDYRLNTASTVAWRERHALTPSGIELRNPFNDLRVVELMASATAATKRFDGRSKAILRAAEVDVLPSAVKDRRDFGVMGELIVEPFWREESERFAEGIASVVRLEFLDAERVRSRAATWLSAPNNRERDLTWRLIACGLWLKGLRAGDLRPAFSGSVTPAKALAREEVRVLSNRT